LRECRLQPPLREDVSPIETDEATLLRMEAHTREYFRRSEHAHAAVAQLRARRGAAAHVVQ